MVAGLLQFIRAQRPEKSFDRFITDDSRGFIIRLQREKCVDESD